MSEIAEAMIERAVRAVAERRYCEDFGLKEMPADLAEHFNRSAVPARVQADVKVALEAVAAPSLYEACEALLRTWFDYHDAHSLTEPVTGASGSAADKAIDALAKARGESV